MVVLSLSILVFPLMEIVHVELNLRILTCLWKEVRFECLK
jgi:hypothetical protein